MGKNKLKKFAEMKELPNVFQYPWAALKDNPCPLKGSWHRDIFGNDNPIVLELGCGKGEYTVGLAEKYPDKNFIGIDIKGARMWSGAKKAYNGKLFNVAFLRTGIELLPQFFESGEVDEIWITFPDPQMQKCRKRLVSSRFLTLYAEVMRPGGVINLKTDSPFLYEYTCRLLEKNDISPIFNTADLYSGEIDFDTSIRTFYEQQWLDRGKTIKLISFPLTLSDNTLIEPIEEDIPRDDYRSFPRGIVQKMPSQLIQIPQ